MDENASLKVRKGSQIFGPMTLVQLAELLASGRIAESDEVSPDGRAWQPLAAYFEQQLAAQSPPPAEGPAAEAGDDDDFLPVFSDAGSSPAPLSTLFDDDDIDEPDASDEEEEAEEPIPPPRPRAKRKRPQPARRAEPETDEESSNLDDILRKLLEHEQTASASNDPRPRRKAGGGAAKTPPMRVTADERREGFVLMFNGKTFSAGGFERVLPCRKSCRITGRLSAAASNRPGAANRL